MKPANKSEHVFHRYSPTVLAAQLTPAQVECTLRLEVSGSVLRSLY
jgi:hypothetical protein